MRRVTRCVAGWGTAVLVAVGLGVTPAAAAAAGAGILGSLDSVTIAADGSIRVTGWAVVRGGGPLAVHVYDTGPTRTVGTDVGPTGTPRPDVEAALGGIVTGYNTWTGFDSSVTPAESGEHRICAYGVAGRDVALLGCRGLATGVAPVGVIDAVANPVSQGQSIRVRGWAYDPDRPNRSIGVDAYVVRNGSVVAATQLSAVSDRPDVGAAIPGAGRSHGIDQDVSLQIRDPVPHRPDLDWLSGTVSVCFFAIGLGDGGNTLLGCRDVDVKPAITGALDDLSADANGNVTARGWSFVTEQPSETAWNSLNLASLDVHQTWSNPRGEFFPSDRSRPDVDAAFAGVGSHHGFTGVTTGVAPGRWEACLWMGFPRPFATDGVPPARVCREITVPVTVGFIDSASVAGEPGAWTVTVRGWAIDPSRTDGSTDVRVVVGETWRPGGFGETVVTTTVDRPDVNALFGVSGKHGFEAVVRIAEFSRFARVCADSATYASGDCFVTFAASTAQVR